MQEKAGDHSAPSGLPNGNVRIAPQMEALEQRRLLSAAAFADSLSTPLATDSLNLHDAFAGVKEKVAAGGTGNIVVIGDSLSFRDGSYLPVFRADMQSIYGNAGIGYQSFNTATGAGIFSGSLDQGVVGADVTPHQSVDGLWTTFTSAGASFIDPWSEDVTLQYLAQPSGGSILVYRLDNGQVVPLTTLNTAAPSEMVRTWDYMAPPGNTRIYFHANGDGPVTFLGLDNHADVPGVRIHRIANGTWGIDNYLQRDATFDQQMRLLSPDVYLVWLGQNDQDKSRAAFSQKVNQFVDRLSADAPNAKIVLIATDNNSGAGLADIAGGMQDVAAARGLDFINFYAAGGNAAFLNSHNYFVDGVHFTPAGGQYFGDMLFNAFRSDGQSLPQPFGLAPSSSSVGDFNNDGIPDLAVTNSAVDNVSVLLGNGDGTFGDIRQYATGRSPSSAKIADVNGDGQADLVVADLGDGDVSVLLGNGDGTFQAAVTYALGPLGPTNVPFDVAVGDLNHDGKPDIVAAIGSFSGNGVSVLLNRGDGTFGLPTFFTAGIGTRSISLADVNGDGNLDLAGANYGGNDVGILLGDGHGAFGTVTGYPLGGAPGAVTFGDFNADGAPDLAVTQAAGVAVLLNQGNGIFTPSTLYAAAGAASVVAGDFDRDGKIDLATANPSADGLLLLPGLGDGSFGNPMAFGTGAGSGPVALTAADLNRDGQPDLIAVEKAADRAGILLNRSHAGVTGRYLFYNSSSFDGNDPGADASDDNAIATDKRPLLPGHAATFVNYTSYSRGINGVMVDMFGLQHPASISAADFSFRAGNDDTPSAWASAPAPAIVRVRPGAGNGGSDRIEIIWPDNAIQDQWLQISVKADASTGLISPDVFYFGNAIGDSGGNTATLALVNATDEVAARNDPHNFLNPAAITNIYDYNRDGKVDATDQIIARVNGTNFLTALKLIHTSAVEPSNSASLSTAALLARSYISKVDAVPTSRKPLRPLIQ